MSSNINVLIVEDEPIIAEDISGFLMDKGYSIAEVCYSKDDAIQYLNEHTPDLVLLDINLDGADEGIEIATYISKNKNLPFIFLTSYTDKKTIDKAKLTYPMGYISKPIDFNSLFSTMEISLFNFSKIILNVSLELDKINKGMISPITKNEFLVLEGIYGGRNNKQISEEQFISVNTVKTHIKNIYEKLNVHSRSELLAKIRNRMKA